MLAMQPRLTFFVIHPSHTICANCNYNPRGNRDSHEYLHDTRPNRSMVNGETQTTPLIKFCDDSDKCTDKKSLSKSLS